MTSGEAHQLPLPSDRHPANPGMTTCYNTGLGEAERCIHPGDAKIHLSEDTVSHLQRSAPSSPLSIRKVPGPASLLDVKIESALLGMVQTLPGSASRWVQGKSPLCPTLCGQPCSSPSHPLGLSNMAESQMLQVWPAPFLGTTEPVLNKTTRGNSLVVQWLGPHSLTHRDWVQSLVGELRSCMPCNATTTSPSLSSAPSVQSSASYSSQLLIRLCLRLDGLGADAEQKSKYKSL